MNEQVSLCFKITNWCNLCCDHCCELSGPNAPRELMPLDRMDKLLTEFKQIETPRASDFFVIGGGEAMAPYFFKDKLYIPRALDMIYQADGIPTIKTNATWGRYESLCKPILKDLATVATKHQIVTTLDISIDEFHDNLGATTNIIETLMKNKGIAEAVRIFLVGFDTNASRWQLFKLCKQLNERGIKTISHFGINDDFFVQYKGITMQIFGSFNTPIYKMGRAAKTQVFTAEEPTGLPSIEGLTLTHCMTVDNTDLATLNYKYQETINGRPLNDVFQSLLTKVYNPGR